VENRFLRYGAVRGRNEHRQITMNFSNYHFNIYKRGFVWFVVEFFLPEAAPFSSSTIHFLLSFFPSLGRA
jgi:hypothetical protein